jgi:four helix bundle protein
METPSGPKIQSFTDLNTWKEAHKLVLGIYELTKNFPREEIYRLVDQLCRAAISITSNIAEGFSRNSAKGKMQFYAIALGSLTEVQNQLILAKDLKYIFHEQYENLLNQAIVVNRLLHGLMKNVPSR